jgi:hypothetical protein
MEALGQSRDGAAAGSSGASLPLPALIQEYFGGDGTVPAQLLRSGMLRVVPTGARDASGEPSGDVCQHGGLMH